MRRRFMAVGFVRKDNDSPRHGQKLARQLLRGAGQGPRQADDVARAGCGQGYPGLLVGAKDAEGYPREFRQLPLRHVCGLPLPFQAGTLRLIRYLQRTDQNLRQIGFMKRRIPGMEGRIVQPRPVKGHESPLQRPLKISQRPACPVFRAAHVDVWLGLFQGRTRPAGLN